MREGIKCVLQHGYGLSYGRWLLVALVGIFVMALCYPGLFPGQFFRFITGGSIYYEDSELYTVGSGAVQAYGIKEIEINWTAGNVRIEAAEGREITMEEQGAETARDEMRYLLRDGKLIIQYSAPRRGFDFWRAGEKQLVVKVPQTLVAVGLDKFTVNAGSAWVYVDGVGAQDTKISFVSGHVELADMQCGVLSLDGVSGAVSGTGAVRGYAWGGHSQRRRDPWRRVRSGRF